MHCRPQQHDDDVCMLGSDGMSNRCNTAGNDANTASTAATSAMQNCDKRALGCRFPSNPLMFSTDVTRFWLQAKAQRCYTFTSAKAFAVQ